MNTVNLDASTVCAKIYTHEDQQFFARVSQDWNPMHVDPVAARRLIAGSQVVHGIHILLTALEHWRVDTETPLKTIICSFNNPTPVGEPVLFSQMTEVNGSTTVEAKIRGLLCSSITFTNTPEDAQTLASSRVTERALSYDPCVLQTLTRPLDEMPEFHLNKLYVIEPNEPDVAEIFPRCYQRLGEKGFAAVIALSYIVGMVCPGLHSVFASLDFCLRSKGAKESFQFWVNKYDRRFRLFEIEFRGSIQGRLTAFQRPPPQPQPSIQELSQTVTAQEFSGSRSLIIGGSRGLGEVTAKILAAGGGDVLITFASGFDDAKAVSDEIHRNGKSKCQVQKFDLTADTFAALDLDWDSLDTIYYFATPKIFQKKAAVFEPELFQEFGLFYIQKFYELCVFLEGIITFGKVRVYYPSSVAVAERPPGLAEYAMTKSAAEVLIEEINRSFKHLTVLSTRLPRMNTDQTASVLSVLGQSNVDTLLPLIRTLQVGLRNPSREQR